MAILFGAQEWADAMKQAIAKSQPYKKAAKKWEGDMYIIVEPDASYKHKNIIYIGLWHGECREALAVKDEGAKNPQYRIFGPFTAMKAILDKKVDPVQPILTGTIKVKGKLAQIMRMPLAAVHLENYIHHF